MCPRRNPGDVYKRQTLKGGETFFFAILHLPSVYFSTHTISHAGKYRVYKPYPSHHQGTCHNGLR